MEPFWGLSCDFTVSKVLHSGSDESDESRNYHCQACGYTEFSRWHHQPGKAWQSQVDVAIQTDIFLYSESWAIWHLEANTRWPYGPTAEEDDFFCGAWCAAVRLSCIISADWVCPFRCRLAQQSAHGGICTTSGEKHLCTSSSKEGLAVCEASCPRIYPRSWYFDSNAGVKLLQLFSSWIAGSNGDPWWHHGIPINRQLAATAFQKSSA